MKLNHVKMVYWSLLLLSGVGAFYFAEGNFFDVITSGLYLVLLIASFSVLYLIGMERRKNYQKQVIVLAVYSFTLHIITYLSPVLIADISIAERETNGSTILVLLINALLLTYLYRHAKGER